MSTFKIVCVAAGCWSVVGTAVAFALAKFIAIRPNAFPLEVDPAECEKGLPQGLLGPLPDH